MVTVDMIGFLITLRMIIFLVIAHCVGDYLFQSSYLALNKGKDKYLLFVHSILYAFGVILTAYIFTIEITILQILALFITHMIIDYSRTNNTVVEILGEKRVLVVDQIVHYLILFLVFL